MVLPALRSDVLDDDAVHLVGDVVEAVDHLFQMIVDLGADDEGHRRRCLPVAPGTAPCMPLIVQLVGAAFDARDLLGRCVLIATAFVLIERSSGIASAPAARL